MLGMLQWIQELIFIVLPTIVNFVTVSGSCIEPYYICSNFNIFEHYNDKFGILMVLTVQDSSQKYLSIVQIS